MQTENDVADDDTIRLLLVVALAAFVPFAVYYRIRSVTNERLDRWQEGVFILFGLRLGAVPVFLGGIAWMIDPQWMAWSSMAIPASMRWFGIAVVGCSGSLVLWTFRNLGENLTDTVVTRTDHTLVTSGPFRYVRHPFYVAFSLGALGESLSMANWFLLLSGCVPLAFLVARTRIEEQKLIERFGDDYRHYMRTTGGFFPKLRRASRIS